MVETKRYEHIVWCESCEKEMKPYVIKEDHENKLILLECTICKGELVRMMKNG